MSQPAKEEKRHTSLFGPIVLIGLGIMLLLGNLDVIQLNFWELLFRFWPVFLIAAGLDILLGRRASGGALIALMLILGVVFGAIWLGYVETTTPFGVVRGESVHQSLDGASLAEVTLVSSVSQMQLQAGSGLDTLLDGNIALHPNEELDRLFTIEEGTAHYTLESGSQSLILPSFGRSNDGMWDLYVNRLIPLDLKVSTGVGSAILNLQDLTIKNLQVDAGVGKVEIRLPDKGNFKAEVNGSVGGILIKAPATIALRIEASTGIGSVRVQGDYSKQGNIYQSPNYNSAINRVDLLVTGGIGSLTVEQLSAEQLTMQ